MPAPSQVPITGGTVTLFPEWVKTSNPNALHNGLIGSTENYWNWNGFEANTFTVEGTDERVQSASKAYLFVMVIAVNARMEGDGYQYRTVRMSKSLASAIKDDDNAADYLGLTRTSNVTYEPARIQSSDYNNWIAMAGPFDASSAPSTYNITGWEISSFGMDLNPQVLRNLADEVKDVDRSPVTLFPIMKITPPGPEY